MSRVAWRVACGSVGILLIASSCSLAARFAQTAGEPPPPPVAATPDAAVSGGPPDARVEPDTGPPPVPPPRDSGPLPPPTCPSDLAARITVTQIQVDTDIRYKTPSYDLFPIDERISLSIAGDGSGYVAWTDTDRKVRVTPIGADLKRSAPDILVDGWDIGGFVALDDGFAVLTRRRDPGEPPLKPETGEVVTAAFLVRYRAGREVVAVPLTGTMSVTAATAPDARDCVPGFLYGRLAWNGVKLGAYFQVHGCRGDPHESFYADKLVYTDDRGRYQPGGWGWNCGNNLGLRLLAEPDAFSAVCLADSRPYPGLNLVTQGVPFRQLSPEFTVAGYVAAQFGSLVKVLADGSYALAWLSRGVTTSQGRVAAAKPAWDIELMRLGANYMPLGPKKWLVETPTTAETNLHMALYGSDRLLMIWERIDGARCSNDRTCWGPYSGTFARLMDLNGDPLSADVPITQIPNGSDDIAVFPDGDLGWAYVVEDARSYQNALQRDTRLPSKRTLNVARMRVCE
ncbi:MAG TPA: hypothetical protein VJR89_25750 [Polyangiales bacterium]|nr:hypothetical protein [Polyangiales bacterium]